MAGHAAKIWQTKSAYGSLVWICINFRIHILSNSKLVLMMLTWEKPPETYFKSFTFGKKCLRKVFKTNMGSLKHTYSRDMSLFLC